AVLGTTTLISVIIGNIIFIVEPSTFPDAFAGTWWSLVTMSTVGYGDYVPHTVLGKLLAAFLILIGICMFAMVTAVISVRVGRMVHMDTKCMECNTSISSEYRYCPFCGSDQDDSIDLF
ncbi:MAG: ion channel, partial [Mariprofundaceae bacterium]|nr:ion channel [Mariprofundaceae bacterium]